MKTFHRLAFFDLDGTLLDAHSKITPEVKHALQELPRRGTLPFLATGRCDVEIQKWLKEGNLHASITMNGQYAQIGGDPVFEETIKRSLCEKLHDEAAKKNKALAFYTPHKMTLTHHNELAKRCYGHIHEPLPPLEPDAYLKREPNMMLLLTETDDEYFRAHFPELTFYRNGPFALDVVNHGVDKGTAVKQIVKALNDPTLETYAFGDGPNDLALLDACDHAVAMGNALPAVKERASYITADNTAGGILQALKHYDLL